MHCLFLPTSEFNIIVTLSPNLFGKLLANKENIWESSLKTVINFAFQSGDNITHFRNCMKVCIKHTVLWTLKSDRDAISLSSSKVADVAEGFTEL